MTALVSQEEARRWLKLGPAGDANDDADLEDKIAQASAIFLQYHSDGDIPEAWESDISPATSPATVDPALVPDEVKQAVAIILHDIWDGRGSKDPMARSYNLQRMLRGPALS